MTQFIGTRRIPPVVPVVGREATTRRRYGRWPHFPRALRVQGARIVRSLARSFGYDIRRKGVLGRTMADALEFLRDRGLAPVTVIDVGVAEGTPDLYSAFPDAQYVLIEPVQEYEPELRRIGRRLRAISVLAAAGSKAGVTQIFVGGSASTTLTVPSPGTPPRTVPMVTIDNVCRELHLDAPFLIKVDVQGAELDVLAGAPYTLQTTEAVVLEVSLFPFYGAPELHHVVNWMASAGFVAYDVFGGHHRPSDRALAQIDMVFVKEHGTLRRNLGWP